MAAQGTKISQLKKLETITGTEKMVVASGTENRYVELGQMATAEQLKSKINDTEEAKIPFVRMKDSWVKLEETEQIKGINDSIEKLQVYQSDYAVAAWNADELAQEMLDFEFYGKKEFLAKYDFYLLDTTDNAGEVTVPVGKLKRNNLLRFEDGSFAPTVGITEAQRAECDVALYLDQAAQQKYCDAGAFNAEAFYNEHGMAKLYNSSGVEVRVLRPWETTETKYTIGIGRMDTVYLLDNVKGESGKTWKGLFSRGMMWDGIDVSLYPLPPTVFGPGPSCTINNKTRNFFFVYPGETNCQSSKGQSNLCTMFYDQQLTYPRVNDMHQVNNMTYARANNSDPEASFPYAEGGYLTLNTYITSLEVYYGTKNLHAAKMFGSGISSNDTCNTEETWLENGGVRFKKSEEEIWTYAKFSDQKDIYYNESGSRVNFSTFLNQEYPKEACMESQMAASFAVETGVTENTDFEFYGSTYRYVVVSGTDGLASLNIRLYRVLAQTVSAYTAEGSAQSWDIEVNLRMSLFGGVNLSGDIYMYCGGGYEIVGTCLFSESGSTGNPVEMYVEPDQRKWHSEKTASIDNLGKFGFESDYKKIAEATNLGGSYSALRQPFAPWSLKKGGSISTGECYYAYDSNYWSTKLNQRVRIGSRFRGYAALGTCSSRNLYAYANVLFANRYSGGSAQALVGAAPLQAE